MVAKVDGNKDPKRTKWLLPVQPYMTVIEAKKSSSLTQNTQAQLVAQVLTLDFCEYSSQLYVLLQWVLMVAVQLEALALESSLIRSHGPFTTLSHTKGQRRVETCINQRSCSLLTPSRRGLFYVRP
jgi:hypothetical protein